MDIVISVSGVPIRLTDERWEHVVLRHPDFELRRDDVVRTLREPEVVVEGGDGEHLAIRRFRPRYCCSIQRDESR